ncbi:MAG: hypothetical protein DRI54_02290 [Bacteroidetes bacterium]|nr:MAG: hypothetical protein DRI54_02290 [Bacteroidota bacterium]
MKRLVLVILSISIGLCSCQNKKSVTHNKNAYEIDSLLNYCFNNYMFNGAILVAQNDKVIYKNAFGYADYTKTKKLTASSVFSLASVSKTFTSTAALLLVERGVLNLDDKLSEFFPDFPNAEKITVYNLITHTAGLPNYLEYGGYFRVEGRPGDFQDSVTNLKVYNYLKSIDTLQFEPGSQRDYSNSGYLMLALVVEKASGKPFHQFIKDEIFIPLLMGNSYVKSEPDLKVQNRAYGFTNFYQPDDDNLMTSGAGGVLSTVEDLYKWHKGLSSASIISKETLNQAYVNTKLNNGSLSQDRTGTWIYGMGWLFRMNETENIAWHDGGLNACSAMFYQDLGRDFTIIILSNKGSTFANHPIYTIRDEIIHILKKEQFSLLKIPISQKMYYLLNHFSTDEAVQECKNLWINDKDKYDFSVNQLNRLGYNFLQPNDFEKAKAVFKLNCEFYPDNANVYDSYAEAFMLNNEYKKAVEFYEKSLDLNPENTNAKNMLQQLSKKMLN